MQIKFENAEKSILAGFLFQTRANANKRDSYLEYEKNREIISEEKFIESIERNKKTKRRIQKLINKMVSPSFAVKLKRQDVGEFIQIVKGVIEDHENFTPSSEEDYSVLTEESYGICKSALEKLEDGMKRSKAQDRS